nr:hypothetical protein GCM10020093_056460 [Planobispora longispora]
MDQAVHRGGETGRVSARDRAGDIRAGDPVEVVHRPDHDVTVALAFRALTREPDLLPRLLAADALPEEDRELVRRRTGA